jgi:hypothetical protein
MVAIIFRFLSQGILQPRYQPEPPAFILAGVLNNFERRAK